MTFVMIADPGDNCLSRCEEVLQKSVENMRMAPVMPQAVE